MRKTARFVLTGLVLLLLAGCGTPEAGSRIQVFPRPRPELEGTLLNLEILREDGLYKGWAYLPASYDPENRNQRLPMLCFVSGIHRSGEGYGNTDIPTLLDSTFRESGTGGFIFVSLPDMDFDSGFINFLIYDFLPLARKQFHASRKREENALGGISSGGFLVSRIFFRYPRRFSVLGQHSSAIARGDIGWWDDNLDKRVGNDEYWFDTGEQDPLIETYRLLEPVLISHRARYSLRTGPGGHRPEYWQEHFSEYIEWYDSRLHRSGRKP